MLNNYFDNSALNCRSKEKLTKVHRVESWILTLLRVWSHIHHRFFPSLSRWHQSETCFVSFTGSCKTQINEWIFFFVCSSTTIHYNFSFKEKLISNSLIFKKQKLKPVQVLLSVCKDSCSLFLAWESGIKPTFLTPPFSFWREITSEEIPGQIRVGSQYSKFYDPLIYCDARHVNFVVTLKWSRSLKMKKGHSAMKKLLKIHFLSLGAWIS